MKQSRIPGTALRRILSVILYGGIILLILGAPQKAKRFLEERDYVVLGV